MLSAIQSPLVARSTPPFALPNLRLLTPDDFAAALDASYDHAMAALETVASREEEPTYANTIVGLEAAGAWLRWVRMCFISRVGADASPELLELQVVVNKRWAAFEDVLHLSDGVHDRVRRLVAADGLTGCQRRTAEIVLRRMTHAGAGLAGPARVRLREINEELAGLCAEFVRAAMADTAKSAVEVDADGGLRGLNDAEREACVAAAATRGLPAGRGLIELSYPVLHPFLAKLEDPALRARLYASSERRASAEHEATTAPVIRRIAELRAMKAEVLGYTNFAAWAAAEGSAGTIEAIDEMTRPIGRAASDAAARDLADLAGRVGHPVRPWDWSYYARICSAGHTAADTSAPAGRGASLSLEKVIEEGLFGLAESLYGFTFRRSPAPGWHADCRVYDVLDADGAVVGTYLLDPFLRGGKQRGARMHAIADRGSAFEQLPIACNCFDFPRAANWGDVLLEPGQVVTMFHEFGHALHCLCSDAELPSLAGTNVPRDFVEYPSQVHELWAASFLRQQGSVDAAVDAEAVPAAYLTAEHMAAVAIDQAWHRLSVAEAREVGDVDEFERVALTRAGIDADVVTPRYKSTFFAHIFAGEYAAKYYSYIWSELLAADTTEWITNAGTPAEREDRARSFIDLMVKPGALVDVSRDYESMRGASAGRQALLRRRGLLGS